MLEVEMKFPLRDADRFLRDMTRLDAKPIETRIDHDRYYRPPDRDFAQTDEALRIRSIGERNCVTYKGPKTDAQTKTRKEIEVPFAEGAASAEQFHQLLTELRYTVAGEVRKQRELWQLQYQGFPVEICRDQVDGLGAFIEIEIGVEDERGDAARDAVQSLASELGLSDSERRSYLELVLSEQGE